MTARGVRLGVARRRSSRLSPTILAGFVADGIGENRLGLDTYRIR